MKIEIILIRYIEEQSQPCRVFSKIFKLDENNQYGYSMIKPLPIGIFKKKPFVDLDILNKAVHDFDPNTKIGHVFEVDIHFQEFNNPKRRCTMRYTPVFLNQ